MDIIIVAGIIFLFALLLGLWLGQKIYRAKSDAEINLVKSQSESYLIQLEKEEKTRLEERSYLSAEIEKIELKYEDQLNQIRTERERFRNEKELLNSELIKRNTEFLNLRQKTSDQKSEMEALQKKFQIEFENLANKILEQKSEKFTELNKSNLENILSPLQERIKGFEENVQKNREDSLKRHSQLDKQLELLNKQNLKIQEEALNLTRALKGSSKIQGNWGEMILERVLEQSGLQKDREYFTQQSFTSSQNKRLQPDVIVTLPGNKRLIIDSKVSLLAYENYINTSEENKKNLYITQLLTSFKKHIDDLSRKNYQQLYEMESPDFVLLFIPIEAVFALASNEYPQLYQDAFHKNIILVTPTTLLAVLRTIENMWQNEKQKENTQEIAIQAGRLYDSFANLLEGLQKIGKQLNTVQNSYDDAMKKLTGRGNLINRVEKLRKLGARTNKQLDERLVDNPTTSLDN